MSPASEKQNLLGRFLRYLATFSVTAIAVASFAAVVPAVGLYWMLGSDPTAGAGVSAPTNQLLIRTDNPSIYYKSGTSNTAWTLIGGSTTPITATTCGANTFVNAIATTGAATCAASTITPTTCGANAFVSAIGTSGAATCTTPAPSYGWFGDGHDGSPTFDGVSTVLGMAPASSVYTAVRDLYLDSPVFSAGVTLNAAGFRVFVKTNLIGPGSGTARIGDIAANAANASGTTAGANGVGRSTQILAGGSNGGTGGSIAGFGGPAAALNTNCPSFLAGTGGVGGAPNAGGVGGGGGTQPAPTALAATNGSCGDILELVGIQAPSKFGGGTGGSGGGAGNGGGGGGGGGGGAGGGFNVVAAYTVTNPTHVVISANGGNGGNGSAAAAPGSGGGGGGGGGGYSAFIYATGTQPTVEANGGTHGTGAGPGGTDGADGSSGRTIVFKVGL